MDDTTKAKAAAIWIGMDKNEKTGVRFGMFPMGKMKEAEKEGFNINDLCVALMEYAAKNGGMIA